MATDLEIWAPEPEGSAPAIAEPIFHLSPTDTAPVPKFSHIRIPTGSQPFLVQGPHSYPNFFWNLIDCGDAFSKTGTSGSGNYSATAITLEGGWYQNPESGDTLSAAPLYLGGSLLVSAGGNGTGIALTSGGAEGGIRSTVAHLYSSCIYGFGTDLKNDTNESWDTQGIRQVVVFAMNPPGSLGPRLILEPGTSARISIYGYDPTTQTSEEKAYITPTSPDNVGTITGTLTDYPVIFAVIAGPAHEVWTSVYEGGPPAVPLTLVFTPNGGAPSRALFISLPPGLEVPVGPPKAYLVGSKGETFNSPWPNGITIPDPLSGNGENLASEWAEMRLHATAFRSSQGMVSVDPVCASR